jgi:predicted RNase H-like nuclease (RuvC/YqgF family)
MADEIEKAVAIARLEQKIESLEKDLEEEKRAIKRLQSDRDSALRWGLIALGSGLISLVTWIFNHTIGR